MPWDILIALLLALLASGVGCKLAIRIFLARSIVDFPNRRSSHSAPTPIGGGIIVSLVIGVGWIAEWLRQTQMNDETNFYVPLIILLVFFLTWVSWKDDRQGLSVLFRLFAQVFSVVVGLLCLSNIGEIFQGLLPPSVDIALTTILWLWAINLTNFMDGIDGLTGVEGVSITIGIIILGSAYVGGAYLDPDMQLVHYSDTLLAVLAGALMGFLYWNWQPAKLFLGDAGSVQLGFNLGWILIDLAGSGLWAAALLLPLYYIFDATITLFRRTLQRNNIFRPHRSHFYQMAAITHASHALVVRTILVLNLGLIALAVWTVIQPMFSIIAVGIGAALTLLVLCYFQLDYPNKRVTSGSDE